MPTIKKIIMPTIRKQSQRLQYGSLAARSLSQTTARFVPALGLAATLLSGSTLAAHAQNLPGKAALTQNLHGKADLFLSHRKATASGWSAVIARCQEALSPAQEQQLKAIGADVRRHLSVIHSLALRIPTRNLNKLAALPFILHLSSDMAVQKCDEFSVESSGAGTAFKQSGLTGQNIRVAVIDSGIHNNADLSPIPVLGSVGILPPRLVAQVNFVADKNGVIDPNAVDDICGHGTHVAGIVGGNGAKSSGLSIAYRTFYGIARQADLINVRVLDANGQSDVSTVIAGIQWVIQNQSAYKIRIINLSVGHPVGESYATDPLCQALEQAWKAGITVVCAAGNAGRVQNVPDHTLDNECYGTAYGSIQSPGNDPYVITVGAMKPTDMLIKSDGTWTHNRNNDRIATYSSRGPSRLDLILKPDIVAPGNKIISVDARLATLDVVAGRTNNIPKSAYLIRSKQSGSTLSGDYFRLSGTSMAAPVVSGAAALLLQQDPTLTPDTIKARLMLSADKWTAPDGTADPCTYGAGYLNIPAALLSTAVPNQFAMSPSLSVDANGNVYINMDRAIWGTDSLTATRAIWGVNGVTDTRALWGTRAIWGTGMDILNVNRALWGTSVWGDRAIWGTGSTAADLTTTALYGD